MAELAAARLRGVHPEIVEPVSAPGSVEITIRIPPKLWNWLQGFVGKNSYTYCVEETIITALRCMAGKDCDIGMNAASFAALTATERDITLAEAMFGPLDEQAAHDANQLLQAAQMAARGVESVARDDIHDDPAQAAAIVGAWSAASGKDIAALIEQARQQHDAQEQETTRALLDRLDAEKPEGVHARSRAPLSETLDDDNPF